MQGWSGCELPVSEYTPRQGQRRGRGWGLGGTQGQGWGLGRGGGGGGRTWASPLLGNWSIPLIFFTNILIPEDETLTKFLKHLHKFSAYDCSACSRSAPYWPLPEKLTSCVLGQVILQVSCQALETGGQLLQVSLECNTKNNITF